MNIFTKDFVSHFSEQRPYKWRWESGWLGQISV